MDIVKRAFFIVAFLFTFFLPINTKIANGCLIAFVVISIGIIIKDYNKKEKHIGKFFTIKTTAFVVILLFFGLFVTDNVSYALKYFERFSAYLLMPIVFSFLQLNDLKRIKIFSFYGLAIGALLSSLILLVVNFKKYFDHKDNIAIGTDLFSYQFTYHDFAEILGFHPTFLGIYFVFVFVVIHEFFQDRSFLVFRILGSFILITALIFLNSRVPFLLVFIYLLFCTFRWFRSCLMTPKGMLKFSIVLSFIIVILAGTIYSLKNTYIYQRMTHQLVWELSENKGTSFDGVYSSDSRISRWKAIVAKSMEKPVFGFGSASEDRVVLDIYRENNLKYALENKYGPHSQYLSFLLEYGLIGFSIFCFYLFSNMWVHFKQKNRIPLLFFAFFAIACVFDSLMYLNAGVIFFAFFGNLFTISSWKKQHLT